MTAVRPGASGASHIGRPRAVAGATPRTRSRVPMPRDVPRPERPTEVDDAEAASSGAGSTILALAVLAALGLVAIAVAALVRADDPSGPGAGEAFVEVHGRALVRRADGTSSVVTGRVDLGPGDALTMQTGRADLELSDDVALAAVASIGDVPATDLVMGEIPLLRRGDLLVSAPDGTTLSAGAGDGQVAVGADSIVRLTRTAALRVGAYRGAATVTSARATRQVPTYRSADLVGAGDLTRPRPLELRSADRWDRLHLGAALALDRELATIVEGLTAGRVDPRAMPERVRRVLARPPAEATVADLVGERTPDLDSAVAVAVAGASSRPFGDAWDHAVGFHDSGATWGLAALDLGVEPDRVVDALLASLEGRPVPTTPPDDEDETAMTDESSSTSAATTEASGATDPTSVEAVGDPAATEAPSDTVAPAPAPEGVSSAPPTAPPATGGGAPPATTNPVNVGPILDPVVTPLAPVVEPLAPVLNPVTGAVDDVVTGVVGTVDDVTEPLDPILGPVTGPLLDEDEDTVPGLLDGLLG